MSNLNYYNNINNSNLLKNFNYKILINLKNYHI